jgi:hypothetical protein
MFLANRKALQSVDLFFVSEPARAVKTYLAYNRSIVLVLTMGMNSLWHNSPQAIKSNDFLIDGVMSIVWHRQFGELCRSRLHLCVAASRFEQERVRYYTGVHMPYLRLFGPAHTVDLWGRHPARNADGTNRRGLVFNHARECHNDGFNVKAECHAADGRPNPCASTRQPGDGDTWPSPAGLNRIASSLGAPIGFEWWQKPEGAMLPRSEVLDHWASFSALLFVPWNAMTQTLKELYTMGIPIFVLRRERMAALLAERDCMPILYKDEPGQLCSILHGWMHPECDLCKADGSMLHHVGLGGLGARPGHGLQADCALHPMNRSAAARTRWLEFADFFTLPHIQQYEDDEDLVVQMSTADLPAISSAMLAAERAERQGTLAMWQALLSQLVHHNQPFGSARAVPLWYPDMVDMSDIRLT